MIVVECTLHLPSLASISHFPLTTLSLLSHTSLSHFSLLCRPPLPQFQLMVMLSWPVVDWHVGRLWLSFSFHSIIYRHWLIPIVFHTKTPLLRLLATMTELREPLLRPTHVRSSHWTPLWMHEMIGNEAANVESAMIQVVGRVQALLSSSSPNVLYLRTD